MFKRYKLAPGLVAALSCMLFSYVSLSTPARASDLVYPGGGTIAQVVDGGGTYSIITLTNLDTTAASYTLYFIGDNGIGAFFSTTATSSPAAILTGSLPVGGSTIIRTNGGGSAIQQGYAAIFTSSQIGGSVVFGLPLANSPLAEASCPMDTGFDYIIGIPFDQTGGSYGVALANSYEDAQYQTDGGVTTNLSIAFYDQNGVNFYSTTMQLPFLQHTAFMLDAQFPPTAGRMGTMVITSIDTSGNPYAIKALGLRANAAGTTFTSVTPLVPCNSNGQYCTN